MCVKSELSESILDSELQEFCQWYKEHYGRSESFESAFITCLCGHYHTFPKQAKVLLNRLKGLELITQKRNIVLLK